MTFRNGMAIALSWLAAATAYVGIWALTDDRIRWSEVQAVLFWTAFPYLFFVLACVFLIEVAVPTRWVIRPMMRALVCALPVFLPILFLNIKWARGASGFSLLEAENALLGVFFAAGGVVLGFLYKPKRTVLQKLA